MPEDLLTLPFDILALVPHLTTTIEDSKLCVFTEIIPKFYARIQQDIGTEKHNHLLFVMNRKIQRKNKKETKS